MTPCIQQCKLDKNTSRCPGCGRTLDQIREAGNARKMARLQIPPDQPMDHAPMERKLKDHEIRELTNALQAELEKEIPILTRYGPLRETLSRVIQDYLEERDLHLFPMKCGRNDSAATNESPLK